MKSLEPVIKEMVKEINATPQITNKIKGSDIKEFFIMLEEVEYKALDDADLQEVAFLKLFVNALFKTYLK